MKHTESCLNNASHDCNCEAETEQEITKEEREILDWPSLDYDGWTKDGKA